MVCDSLVSSMKETQIKKYYRLETLSSIPYDLKLVQHDYIHFYHIFYIFVSKVKCKNNIFLKKYNKLKTILLSTTQTVSETIFVWLDIVLPKKICVYCISTNECLQNFFYHGTRSITSTGTRLTSKFRRSMEQKVKVSNSLPDIYLKKAHFYIKILTLDV